MTLHIKDTETDRVVRALAEIRHVSITRAIHDACAECLARHENTERPLRMKIQPIFEQIDRLKRAADAAREKQFFDDLWDEPSGDFSKTDVNDGA